MTATDWHKLKQDASETIQGIDMGNLTKDAYILLGASFAILDHTEPEEAPAISTPAAYVAPSQPIAALPANKSLLELVEDELSDAEMYYAMNEFDIARDELRHADRFLAVLRAKGDGLQELIARRDAIAARL